MIRAGARRHHPCPRRRADLPAWRSRHSRLRGLGMLAFGLCALVAQGQSGQARRGAARQGTCRAVGVCARCAGGPARDVPLRVAGARSSSELLPPTARPDQRTASWLPSPSAALARAAAASVLAPDAPSRRLVSFDDATSQWLWAHLTWGGRLFGVFIVWRALNRSIGPVASIGRCDAHAVRRRHRGRAGSPAGRAARRRRRRRRRSAFPACGCSRGPRSRSSRVRCSRATRALRRSSPGGSFSPSRSSRHSISC